MFKVLFGLNHSEKLLVVFLTGINDLVTPFFVVFLSEFIQDGWFWQFK
jgi:hypothetical protein